MNEGEKEVIDLTQLEENVVDLTLEDIENGPIVLEPKGRYLSVHGSYIDQLGFQPHQLVTAALKLNQQVRDQYHHHITLINHLEISQMTSTQQKEEKELSSRKKKKLYQKTMYRLCREIFAQFGLANSWASPIDLGMGSCWNNEAITYFRVIHWPLGQLMREYLGLGPSNFHITVGFSPHDVHLYKGPATLLCLQEGYFCPTQQMDKLVDYAAHYATDVAYIKRLYHTCWRHGYYNQAARLTQILTVCKKIDLSDYGLDQPFY